MSMERLAAIAEAKGVRPEDITVERNEAAPPGYAYAAWVGAFDIGATVGTGPNPEAAIEDLLDQLEDK